MADSVAPVRATLAERVQSRYLDGDRIDQILEEIENISKKVHMDCPKCGKRSLVDVPDDPRKLEALLKLIEQTEGKPGTVDADAAGVHIIVNRLPWPGEDDKE
jgi:hypothetical protein